MYRVEKTRDSYATASALRCVKELGRGRLKAAPPHQQNLTHLIWFGDLPGFVWVLPDQDVLDLLMVQICFTLPETSSPLIQSIWDTRTERSLFSSKYRQTVEHPIPTGGVADPKFLVKVRVVQSVASVYTSSLVGDIRAPAIWDTRAAHTSQAQLSLALQDTPCDPQIDKPQKLIVNNYSYSHGVSGTTRLLADDMV